MLEDAEDKSPFHLQSHTLLGKIEASLAGTETLARQLLKLSKTVPGKYGYD